VFVKTKSCFTTSPAETFPKLKTSESKVILDPAVAFAGLLGCELTAVVFGVCAKATKLKFRLMIRVGIFTSRLGLNDHLAVIFGSRPVNSSCDCSRAPRAAGSEVADLRSLMIANRASTNSCEALEGLGTV